MNTNVKRTSDCKAFQSHLPDLFLDRAYADAHPEANQHLSACAACATELAELRSTFALLDEFGAPEPAAYFDTRLRARVREAQKAEPEGLWERMRSFLLFSTGRSFRPAMTGALALALIAGGAGIAGLHGVNHKSTPQTSSTVNDLKVLDNNASAEQQMGQLLDQSGAEDEVSQSSS